MPSISLKKAILINGISKYSTIVFTLVFNIALARLLMPEDHGVVAVVTVFSTFFNVLADMGIGPAVIQNKELSSEDIYSIFSFTIVLSFILGGAFCVLSVILSILYSNSVYIPVGCTLSISLVFNAMNMVPQAILMKEKKFVNVGIRTVTANILSGIAGITMAVIGFKYYALVAQSVLSSAIAIIWNCYFTRPRIGKIKKESIDKIRVYSSFQLAFSIVNYFARNMDTILIGKNFGDKVVGVYDKAYKLTVYPTNNLSSVITPALHPFFSEYQNNSSLIYKKYIRALKLLSILGIYITGICFTSSKEIILILYGSNWIDAAPCFRMMSLSIWSQMLLATTGSIFQSCGNTKMLFVTGLITSALTVAGIIEGVIEGSIYAVSRNIAISYNLQMPFSFYMLISKTMHYDFKSFIIRFVPDLLMLLCVVCVGVFVNFMGCFSANFSTLVCFIINSIIVSVVFLILAFVFGQFKYLKKLIR